MAHILPDDSRPRAWEYPLSSPPSLCPHGVPYAQRCNGCGWVCPTCKRSYAPWVRECNYRHDENWQAATPILASGSGEPVAVNLRLPGETAGPHYQRKFAASSVWQEVWPGLQCRSDGPPTSSAVYVSFRLTPDRAGNDPGPIEAGR